MDCWGISDKGHYVDAKTFKNINFSMTLPKPTLYDERVEFSFQYKVKPELKGFKAILIGSSIKNVFGEIQKYNEEKKKLIGSRSLSFSMDVHKINTLLRSEVSFLYLCDDGQKCIISYYFENHGMPPMFLGVERCLMTEEEKDYFVELIKEKNSTEKVAQDVVAGTNITYAGGLYDDSW